MQSLAALATPRLQRRWRFAYEQATSRSGRLRLPAHDIDQQFLRMAFNVVARNPGMTT